jgi:prephenate dehydrogenase
MTRPKVTIIGLGLIGASIGMALREAESDFQLVGHDKDGAVSKKARDMGAVEKTEWNLVSATEGADLVIMATPTMAIKETFEAIAPYLSPDCVVTDTSSVKVQVLQWADDLLPQTVHFVGGDPMVSSDDTGIDAARADLFTGATYCIVPSLRAHPAAVELVTSMVRSVGAFPFFLGAAEHDGQIVGVEHLPMMAATALLMTTTQSSAARDISRLPSRTFWRATHLSSTDPATYRDICLTNSENISRWIDLYIERLKDLQQRLSAADAETWENLFAELINERARWQRGRVVAEEEATSEALNEIGGFRSLSSMIGLSQFRDLKDKLDKRERK